MMHRCSSSCSCGMYNQSSDYSGYSMFFSTPTSNQNHHQYYEESAAAADYDQSMYSSSSSYSVDCTLSLGTPSTRLSSANERPPSESRRSSSSSAHKSGRGAGAATDHHVTRRCANCDTTSTPLWRNGPRGPKSLCNACGIRYKKEERRASAAAAAAASANGGGAGGMDMMHNSWVHHHTQIPYNNYSSTAAAAAYGNEYGYMEDDDRDSAFLSWRLNVHCS